MNHHHHHRAIGHHSMIFEVRFQMFQFFITVCVCVCVSTWRQVTDCGVAARASGYVLKPWRDPLRVRGGEQLCGRLAELQDLGQHGDSLVRVLDAFQRMGKLVP